MSDTSASPSPSPSPSPTAASTSAAAASSSAATSAPPAPIDLFIPSHTRQWTDATRNEYATYCAQHESALVTPLLPSISPCDASNAPLQSAMSVTQDFLSTVPAVDSLEARGRVISNDDECVIDFGRGKAWIHVDDSGRTKSVRVGKQNAKINNLIGQPYGQIWELDNKSGALQRTQRKRGHLGTELLDSNLVTTKNNSQLYDTNTSQKLTQEEIIELQKSGKSSKELIDTLISNSSTFATKTEFSQEKYIKKKKAKYCSELQITPCTLAKVLDTFYEKDPRRGRNIRPDTISLLLSYADIKAGTNSLIVDGCNGFILGSVLYRQQGLGYIVHAYDQNQRQKEGMKKFAFAENVEKSVLHIPLETVISQSIKVVKHADLNIAASGATTAASASDAMDTSSSSSSGATPSAAAAPSSSSSSSSAAASSSLSSSSFNALSTSGELTPEYILSHQVDTIILGTRYDPFALLQSLWPYLKPAGRFVIYDEVIESLSACHAKLSSGGLGGDGEGAVNLIVAEQFFRNLQVLPNRTHPFVNMSASGGYILAGIKMNPMVK